MIFLLLGDWTTESVGEIVGCRWLYIVKGLGFAGTMLELQDGDFDRDFVFDGWKQMFVGGVIERSAWDLRKLLIVGPRLSDCWGGVGDEEGC